MSATVLAIHQPAIETINDLERRIDAAEDDVEAFKWQQAALVVQQLQTMTQRELAAQWINPRTEKPYTQKHVWSVRRVFDDHGRQEPRPRFSDLYRAVKYQQQRHWDRPAMPAAPIVPPKHARVTIQERRRQCQELAERGASIHQIAEQLGVGASCINKYAKDGGYEITARRAGKTRRHDDNRIVEQMAMDAENLTADVDLIAFGELDHSRLPAWIAAFTESQARLREFILKLKGAAT